MSILKRRVFPPLLMTFGIYTSIYVPLCMSLCVMIACDDEAPPQRFDVLVTVDQSEANAPATLRFDSRNNGPLSGEYTYKWSFGDGAESAEASPTHTFEEPGEYEVTLTLSEAGGGSGEGAVSVNILPELNLAVSALSFSPMTTLAPGDEVAMSWSLSQSARAVSAWRFGVYLVSLESGPPSVTADPESLAADGVSLVATVPALQPEGGGARDESFDLTFMIPEGLASGEYELLIVADDEGLVGERDRADNIARGAVPVSVRGIVDSGPDLSVCAISVDSFQGVEAGQRPILPLGEQLEARLCLANLGDRPLVDTPYAVYLSEDATLDDGDLLLAQGVEQAIGASDRIETTLVLDVPIETPVGAYRLLAVADPEGSVAEQREDNNLRASPVPFELVEPGEVEGVDLVVTSLAVDSERVFWGQNLSGSLTLTHRGDVDVSRLFVIRFNALSVDAGVAPQPLPSLNIPGIAAGESLELPFELSITRRIAEGRYRIQVEVDPTNSTNDVNPGNNRRSLPDIVTVDGDPSFDPAARALTLSQTTVDAGQSLNVTLDLANLGDDASGAFKVAVLISDDARIGVGDRELDRYDIESLTGSETRSLELTVPIPLDLDQAVGAWHLAAIVDPDRELNGELSEENNTVFAEELLTVTGSTGGCAEDNLEENDDASRAVSIDAGLYEDLGACDAADWFSVNVPVGETLTARVSASGELEEGEGYPTLELGDGSGAILRPAERRGDDLVLTIPASDILSRAYLRVTGGGGAINYNLALSLDAPAASPALELSQVSVQPGVAESGSAVEVSVTLTNLGAQEVPAGTIEAVLVSEPTLESAALGALSSESAWETPSLSAGASAQVQTRLTLPAGLPDRLYFLRLTHSALDPALAPLAWAVTPLRVDEAQACTSDRFEPNGSPHEADGVTLGAREVGSGRFTELFSCVGDDDWYRLTLEEGEALEATIDFNPLEGDLELELYEADGQTLIAESTSLRGQESVTVFRSPETTDYLLRVFLKPSDVVNVAAEYTLDVEIGASQTCGDDGFEPNASAEEAALLPDGSHDLVVCPGGDDWFRFQVPAGNIVSYQVSVGFDGVDMSLFGPDDNLIETNNRRIIHEALTTGSYRLRVSPRGTEPSQYTLVVSGVSGLDLAASDLRLTSTSGGAGAELYANVTIESRRGDSASDVLVRFTLSEDIRISADDALLGEQRVPLIEGASSVELQQRITIPSVEPGLYSVICEVDPNLELEDFSLGNNVARASFEVGAACVDDDERENEGPRTATPISWTEGEAVRQGVICALTEDWYSATIPAGEHTITLTTPSADLDLSVFDATTQALLATSSTTEAIEVVTLTLAESTEVYLRVDGFFNEEGAYTLSWTR